MIKDFFIWLFYINFDKWVVLFLLLLPFGIAFYLWMNDSQHLKSFKLFGIFLEIVGTSSLIVSLDERFRSVGKPSIIKQLMNFRMDKFPRITHTIYFTADGAEAFTNEFDVTTRDRKRSEEYNLLMKEIQLLDQKTDRRFGANEEMKASLS